MSLEHRLHERGWTEKELSHLHAHLSKSQHTAVLGERFAYWFFLCILVVLELLFGFRFLRVLNAFPVLAANLVTAFAAGIFAALFGHVLHTLDSLSHKHHALFLITGVITILCCAVLLVHTALRLGVLFAVVFALLYSYYWYLWHERTKPA